MKIIIIFFKSLATTVTSDVSKIETKHLDSINKRKQKTQKSHWNLEKPA